MHPDTSPDPGPGAEPDPAGGSGRRQTGWDLALALGCVALAVLVQVTGTDAVPANRDPDPLSVLLTVSAVAPLAWRRRHPLAVLICCFPGLLVLLAARYAAGAAPLGVLVAFYTVAAWGSPRTARRGLVVLALGVAVLIALRPVDLSAEGVAVNSAILLVGWVLGTGARERRALHASLLAESARQVELERERGSRAAAEERLRITRELHDVLGHAMSVMVVQAGVAEHLLDTRPDQARAALARVGRTGRSSLQEMRRLLSATRDAHDGLPLRPQPRLQDLPALLAQVEAAGLPVRLTDGVTADAAVPAGVELAVYRVVQEALTNTLKHAGPARAQVRLTRNAGDIEVEVLDDGHGPVDAAAADDGHGLTGMRERVAIHSGELTTGPAPAGGFRVWARFPLPVAAQREPGHDAVAGPT